MALSIDPEYYSSLGSLGITHLSNRDFRLADSCFDALANREKTRRRIEARLLSAYVHVYQGQITEAVAKLRQGIIADSLDLIGTDDPPVVSSFAKHLLLATLYSDQGDHSQAMQLLEELIRRRPPLTNFMTRRTYGIYIQMLAESNDLDKAESIADAWRDSLENRNQDMSSYFYGAGAIEFVKGNNQ